MDFFGAHPPSIIFSALFVHDGALHTLKFRAQFRVITLHAILNNVCNALLRSDGEGHCNGLFVAYFLITQWTI